MFLLQVTLVGLILMPSFVRIVSSYSRRFFATMASEYETGSLSMAFVTVPDEKVGKALAKYVCLITFPTGVQVDNIFFHLHAFCVLCWITLWDFI